ncbi:unnamed protein product [Caenorhabditis sp. 36 PRJEB53466]|nr:unnamed protein product [Caenorhabditis sp. 36 PRJEB53466]
MDFDRVSWVLTLGNVVILMLTHNWYLLNCGLLFTAMPDRPDGVTDQEWEKQVQIKKNSESWGVFKLAWFLLLSPFYMKLLVRFIPNPDEELYEEIDDEEEEEEEEQEI